MIPAPSKATILIVDDVPENIRMLMEILKDDYATIPATSGETALEKVHSGVLPDLILLDIMMLGIDGYETCRQLQQDPKTRDIPVIFITAVAEALGDAKAFDVGAADYIAKPFNPTTVKARVKHQIKLRAATQELLRLHSLALDANPISGLPGSNSIRQNIERAITCETNQVVVYADLDYFKAYNDKYGFDFGDDIIHYTASLLAEALTVNGVEDGFLGHMGGDAFVLLIPQKAVANTLNFIINQFDHTIPSFYLPEDAAQQCIKTKNRTGEVGSIPLMSISLGGVYLRRSQYHHFLDVNDACTEVKQQAKQTMGSCFFIDRRKNNT